MPYYITSFSKYLQRKCDCSFQCMNWYSQCLGFSCQGLGFLYKNVLTHPKMSQTNFQKSIISEASKREAKPLKEMKKYQFNTTYVRP